MAIERQQHWQTVYSSKGEDEVSCFQEEPQPSMDLLRLIGATPAMAVLDIGGGASRFVDHLLAAGHTDVSVLDLSAAALEMTRTRLGSLADQVDWIVADASDWMPSKKYAVWHDRAAFHFLTEPAQRQGYMDRLRAAIDPGGHVIVGTFALDGPEKCSGLPVARYNADSLAAALGHDFDLIDTRRHDHLTPWSTSQKFQFSTFVRRPSAP